MGEPDPELEAEDALRGVVNQLTIRGHQMPVIIPGSVIEALRFFAELLTNAKDTGYLPELLVRAMPWAAPLPADDLHQLASDLAEAAGSGDHAPERLAAVLREWRETAEISGDAEAMSELAESGDAAGRGDFIRGSNAVRALRPRQ